MVTLFKKRGKLVGSVLIVLLWVLAYFYVFGDRYVPPAKEEVPRLTAQLFDRMDTKRENAAFRLGEIGPDAKDAVPYLIKALNDVNVSVQQAAVIALGKIGPDAKEAVPALLDKLNDSNKFVREFAAISLGKIGPEPGVVDALIKALDDEDSTVRGGAALGLYYIGPDAAPALVKLTKMAEDPKEEPWVQDRAREAMNEIDSKLETVKKEK
jgi:HEAT repeat protein